jgi:viologen exporter family transport system ATP-binding protein
MEVAIRLQNLCKSYSRRRRGEGGWRRFAAYLSPEREVVPAIEDLSFTIERGEAVGLIGENGAGKSTTVKILTGILSPTGGRVETLGLDPFRQRRQLALNIGAVFGQKPQLLWDIPVGESFKLLKLMYRIPDDVYRFSYGEAVERLGLGKLLTTPVRLLSLGQRMRCDLAASLLHAPLIAFLDEPTIGLDVLVKERVREHISEMRRRFGTTILLTTHDLKDISATCERAIALDKGRLLFDGPLTGFEAAFGGERVIVADLSCAASPDAAESLARELAARGAVLEWEGAKRVRIECRMCEVAPWVTQLLLERLSVKDLSLRGPDIDSLVTRIYRTGKDSR